MSYRTRRRTIATAKQALGDVTSTISDIAHAFGTASTVARDPYFGEVVCRIDELHAVKTGQPFRPCAPTPPGSPSPVGLDKVATGLAFYTYAEANPWVYPLAIAAFVGLPLWVGYRLGKTSRG